MPYTTSPFDGAQLFYRDYRPANSPPPFQPHTRNALQHSLVFVHGWPMSSAMWEHLMLPMCESHRIRCIAIDRRGFGKSEWSGHRRTDSTDITYATFATDTVHILEELNLKSIIFVAASMGCGETLLAYFASEWVRERCKGFIWVGCSLPLPLQTEMNVQAPSRDIWDSILQGLRADRPAFVEASLPAVLGVQGGPSDLQSSTSLSRYERIIDQADGLAMERCVQIITEKDFTQDLGRLAGEAGAGIKVLILHGDRDHGMPFEASGKIVAEILGNQAEVRIYETAAHGLYLTHQERVLKDILWFAMTV